MPIPPPPFTCVCPICSWRKTFIPRSDALAIGRDIYVRCPKCGHGELEVEPATSLEILQAQIAKYLPFTRR